MKKSNLNTILLIIIIVLLIIVKFFSYAFFSLNNSRKFNQRLYHYRRSNWLQLPYTQTKACVKGCFIWYNTSLMLSYQI
jgi:flagellar basal body-associated protein FliL